MLALLLAPHPDDETIGCAGTILHLARSGFETLVLHVFDGSTGIAGLSPTLCAAARRAEAREAAAELGCVVAEGLGLPDRSVHEPGPLIRPLIAAIRRHSPALLLAPHLGDRDFEHGLVARAADEAFWMASSPLFPELGSPCPVPACLLGYEVWTPIPDVALAVDYSPYAARKEAALRRFASQDRESGWAAAAMGLGVYRGTTLQGGGHAEAFTLRRANLSVLETIGLFGSRKAQT